MTETKTLDPADLPYVYAVPGEGHVIDAVRADGTTAINGETLEQVRERYPAAERFTWEAWLAEKAARQQTPITWIPTTAEQYNDMLNILPPIAWNGWAFMVGEPEDHCAVTEHPRFRGYRMRGSKEPYPTIYEVASRPMTVAEFKIARIA